MSPARAMLIEVGGMGMIREIMFKQNYIQDPRRAAILVDEVNGVFWVWLGHDVNMKTRKAIIPVAEKLVSERGYTSKTDGHRVGENCTQMIVLDQKQLGDPSVQQNHQVALNIFNMNYIEDGRFVVQFSGAAAAAPKGGDPRSNALAGIMLVSILETAPEVFVGKSSQGIYSVDIGQGTIKFQIKDGNIQLVQGSAALSDQVQRAFQEYIQALK